MKTKEWTIPKILRLAKLHVSITHDLKPLFLANLQDIHTTISGMEETLLEGFYGMQCTPKGLPSNPGMFP
jgi:hypothetical protein